MRLIKSFFLCVCVCISSQGIADVNTHFNAIKSERKALYTFFKNMPKGGELHYHYTGGAYPEEMLLQAAKGNYCIDPETFKLNTSTGSCKGSSTKALLKNQPFYNKTIRAWSMKNFVPGKKSGHDHFFSSFSKFGSVPSDYHAQLLAKIIQRAAAQHELYMEIQMFDLHHASDYGQLIKNVPGFAEKKQILLKNKPFQNSVKQIIDDSYRYLADTRHELGCDTTPQNAACAVTVKFQCFVKRAGPLNDVFAEALACFAAAAESKNIVGVNLVQAEDDKIALQDYNAHMQIFKYLHNTWPTVNIALHAGELSSELVPLKDLRFHIHGAIFTGQAQRIGHGVDIADEDHPVQLLNHMAQKPVAVEINLISNQVILNISGKQHPLALYLKHHVPVVLSTDDEGILRTDLTSQYVEAVLTYGLDYPAIKMINRNALTYSFLPGKSLWVDPVKAEIVPVCQDLESVACKTFIKNNEKAKLQWKLETKLVAFEHHINQ